MASKKKAVKKKSESAKFGHRDRVRVNYSTRCYDIIDVPGIIMKANRTGGFRFKVKLVDEKDTLVLKGHDDDGGAPGSGPFIYCEEEHLELVEKYEPKRLTGVVKEKWVIGDTFSPKKDFSEEQDDFDDITGVVPEMVKLDGEPLTVVAIVTKLGPTWLIDGRENYCWLPEWVDPIE
jgi:hypothetical protein